MTLLIQDIAICTGFVQPVSFDISITVALAERIGYCWHESSFLPVGLYFYYVP